MPCFQPIRAWKSKVLNPSGKRNCVFSIDQALDPLDVFHLPCGRCIHCTMVQAADKGAMAVHEAMFHPENTFITLTYNNDQIPDNHELHKPDVQKFAKRLLRARGNDGAKILWCGEYGSKTFRPHYHAILFGIGFDDKKYLTKSNGITLYTSDELQYLWRNVPASRKAKGLVPMGNVSIGNVTFESAAYVARYATKKHNDHKNFIIPSTGVVDGYVKEYCRSPNYMARQWYEDYAMLDAYPHDFIVLPGRKFEMRVPKKYDEWLAQDDPDLLAHLKEERKKKAIAGQLNKNELKTAELYKNIKLQKLIRTL